MTRTDDSAAPPPLRDPAELAHRLVAGERRALARAITLVESTRSADRPAAHALLAAVAGRGDALRVGLSGPPGVGKSTLIEALGMALLTRGRRVAVLAVDPSSARSGGSILGDKTRMPELARADGAFVRPSPSGGALGGVARRTRETIRLVEAAGHDVVLVETVGVGQSETMVAEMTDVFVLLAAPGGGDELQGVKRGIMEIADIVLVNKADGDLASAARRTASDYAGALRLLRPREADDPPGWPRAMTVSALTGDSLMEAWDAIAALDAARRRGGGHARRRRDQAVGWMRFELEQGLHAMLRADPAVRAMTPALERAVAEGAITPDAAAARALAAFARGAGG